jgi:putative N-acetylmannosamine-6-phosphate epimerase
MKTLKTNLSADICGTSLRGYVHTSYKTLHNLFGKPNLPKAKEQGGKIDAEWILETPYGIASIYNYKDGKNYNGRAGTAVKDITEWHIGGLNKETAILIQQAVEFYLIGYQDGHANISN